MLRNIVHEGSGQLSYEIREIVVVAKELEKMGVEVVWENIGDPIQKGEQIPDWIKRKMTELVNQDETYGYVATQGIEETRQFLARKVNMRGGCQITEDDIVFFNGLGDAVSKIFGFLKREARVIGPSPAYSTHSSAEAAHSGYSHLTYELDPYNNWMPDLTDLENKIKYNDSIAGMLIINPDNPTGTVYPRDFLEEMLAIAKKYNVFVLCDEIYANIVYNGAESVALSEVIGGLPGIALRGISKEFPWPGGRCGWIEVFNQHRDHIFEQYIQSLVNAKMLEVCSTSLPQYAIPSILGDERYISHLQERSEAFQARANEAYEIFSQVDGIHVTRPQGAFYMSVLFEENILNEHQRLRIDNPELADYIGDLVHGVEVDKRFVYYLLGSTGICVVPLTGFCCERKGFRITLLESDDELRRWTWHTIARSIEEYINSVPQPTQEVQSAEA